MDCGIRLITRVVALSILMGNFASLRAQAQTEPAYTIIDLGTLGGTRSYAQGMNDSGQVTGYASLAGDAASHAFRYDPQTGMRDLGTLGGTNSKGFAINANGQVAGEAMLTNGKTHAVRWTGTTPLDIYPGSSDNSTARAINAAGHLTGSRAIKAFLFDGGSVSEFSAFGASVGNGINNADLIVGSSSITFYGTRVFGLTRTPAGVITPTINNYDSAGEREYFAINNNGIVVGRTHYYHTWSDPTYGTRFVEFYPDKAAMWQNGVRTDLGVRGSVALAVNDRSQVVGASEGKAVLFENGQTIELDSLIDSNSGWTLTEATGINNNGWIVGTGKHLGQDRAFLLAKDSPAQVSGTVNLQGIAASAPSQSLTFTSRAAGLPDVVKTLAVAPNGTFSFSLSKRSGTLTIKGDKYLSTRINLNTTSGDVAGLNVLLRAGDGNNDNAADVSDLLLILNHFNQIQGSTGYLEACDFNLDGTNDVTDLLLVIGNYNQTGD